MTEKVQAKLKSYFTKILTTDLRALAAMRIAIGLTLLLDLLVRSMDLSFFYTATGIVSSGHFSSHHWSIHHLNDSLLFQSFLFFVAAVFGIMLTIGYQTRIASIASWFLLVSLLHRNELIINSGDNLLCCLLFFGMFLPWAQRCSVDKYFGRIKIVTENGIIHFAAIAIVLQLMLVYAETSFYKSGSQWRSEFTALYYVFMSQQYSTRISEYLLNFPNLLKFFTFSSIALEATFTVLLLIPVWFSRIRTFLFLSIVGLHFGIFIFMDVGMFPMISIASAIILIPSACWDWISNKQSEPSKVVVLRTRFDAIALVTILILVASSPFRVDKTRGGIHDQIQKATYAIGLHQPWSMFSPQAGRDVWWYVVKGEYRDGSVKNLFPVEHELSFLKPERVNETFRNQRWSKLMSNLWYHSNHRYRKILLRSYCTNQLTDVELIYLSSPILLEQQYGPISQTTVAKINCSTESP